MYNILICDDDTDIVNALKICLADQNYTLFSAYNGQQALDIVKKHDIHLVLMDIMMPVMDGISAMIKIRKTSNVPVILLTAKSEHKDKILGLNFGADDYITKPFHPSEVTARVHSQLRRYLQLGSGTIKSENFIHEGIELNTKLKQVTLDGTPISLTQTEYGILKLLIAHPGQIFSPKEIYRQVWKEEPLNCDNTVAVHIRHLREKLELNPAEPRYIKVIFGHGYKMEKGIQP